MSNKKHFLLRETIVSIIIIILTFSFFITCTIFTPTVKNTYRWPQYGYASLEEEYIAAIDSFLRNDSQIVYIPKDSIFIIDNATITIKDKNSNAHVTCRFVLNGTVPVYEWSYTHPYKTLIRIGYFIIVIILTVILALALCTVANCIFRIYDSRKKRIANNIENNDKNCDIYPCGCEDCEQQDMCELCPCNDCSHNPDKHNDENVEDEQVEIEDEYEDEKSDVDEKSKRPSIWKRLHDFFVGQVDDSDDEDFVEDMDEGEESDIDERSKHPSIWKRLHGFFVDQVDDSDDEDFDKDIDEDSDEDLEVLPYGESENDSNESSGESTEVLSNEEFEENSDCSSPEIDEELKDVPEVNDSAETISEEEPENVSSEDNPEDDFIT